MELISLTDGREIYKVNINEMATIKELKTTLIDSLKKENFELKFQNKELIDEMLIKNIIIKEGEYLDIIYNTKQGFCGILNCKVKLGLSSFACSQCQIKYCGRHRIQEAHFCKNIEELKKIEFSSNEKKILDMKFVKKKF